MTSSSAKLSTALDFARWNLCFETLRRRIHRMWAMKCWQKRLLKCGSRRSRRLNLVELLNGSSYQQTNYAIGIGMIKSIFWYHILKRRSYWQLNGANFWMLAHTVKLIISSDLPQKKTIGVCTCWCPIHYFKTMEGYEMNSYVFRGSAFVWSL